MNIAEKPHILGHLSSLSDITRCRLLLLLEQQELTVSEICAVMRLPQSTVSRHLKILSDDGWSSSRPDGTRRLYKLATATLAAPARELWELARAEIAATAAAQEDGRRLAQVLSSRRTRSREFFDSAAGRWDRMRDELFGARVHSTALLGLLDSRWTVGDLGCGTGHVSESLAPFVSRVIAVDGSSSMLDAARDRLAAHSHVELRHGQLEQLPLTDASLDAATLILVLHHLHDPQQALREVSRTLRPHGRLLLVDMLPHERLEYQQEMGHVWLGFSETQLSELLDSAGLELRAFQPLPSDAEAAGPALFACTATPAHS
jgi:ubiquinone/menaquinone biosynthesis C-methylase UbiE/DNA-binding transcriptional ArsR family regulator